MKTRRSFLALAVLALLAAAACAPKSKQVPVEHPIHGLWAWEVSDKGFFGFSRGNPDGSWITSTIRFAPDGRYEQFQDGKLIVSGRYTLGREDTVFGEEEVVHITTETGQQWRRVVMDLTASTLSLAEDGPNGDGAAFTRVPE